MNHQESLFSPTDTFQCFIVSVRPWISLGMDIYWCWILRTSSSQCHNNPVLVPPCKPPYHVKDLYYGQTYDLKTRVDIYMSIDVVPVEYGKFAQTFHLTNVVLSVYYWAYLQVGLCYRANC